MELGESETVSWVVRTSKVGASVFARIPVHRRLSHLIHWGNFCEGQKLVLGSCDCGTVVRGGRSGHRMEFARVRLEVPGGSQWVPITISSPFWPCGSLTTLLFGFFAAWATIIHLSHGKSSSGMKLKDLARNTDEPASVSGGLLLLLRRTTSRATSRRIRGNYEYVIPASVNPNLGLTW